MGPENNVNLARVHYFPLEEYIDRITLSDNVRRHLDEETSKVFDKYIQMLSQYSPEIVARFLINSFYSEIKTSNLIEHHITNSPEISEKNIFYDSLNVNHQRIKNLHKFALESDTVDDYRTGEAWVGYFDKNNKKHIYWYGSEPEDIKKFMDDYIKCYKTKSVVLLNSSPFFKSALISLLFIRIHPFSDGNGRTARLLYDMKFTELINSIYKTQLKISPLHISNSILINQCTYVNRLDSIYFDLEHDCNDEINRWFQFCLDMTDEQLFFLTNEMKENRKELDELEKRLYIEPSFIEKNAKALTLSKQPKK